MGECFQLLSDLTPLVKSVNSFCRGICSVDEKCDVSDLNALFIENDKSQYNYAIWWPQQ